MEVKRETAKLLISRLGSASKQDARTAALCELRLLSKTDPDIRPIIADEGGIPYIAESLYTSSISQENAAAALLNVSISARDAVVSCRGVLDAISHVLSHPLDSSPAAVQSAAATVFSVLVDEKHRPAIGSRRDIVLPLIDIVRSPDSPVRSVKDSLKALFGIAVCPSNRPTMIELGAVGPLLDVAAAAGAGRAGTAEDSTAVIALLAACEEAVGTFDKVSGIDAVAKLIDPAGGASERVRENAIAALMNLVQSCGSSSERDIESTVLIREAIGRNEVGVSEGINDMMLNGCPKGKSKAEFLLGLLNQAGMAMIISNRSSTSTPTPTPTPTPTDHMMGDQTKAIMVRAP